jgi:hypothetical protein
MDTQRRDPVPEKPAKQDKPPVATRDKKQDEHDWVDRPDWHGAGVVGENHTD